MLKGSILKWQENLPGREEDGWDAETSFADLSTFVSLSLREHQDALKRPRPNSHHWYPLCTRCWVSSGCDTSRLQILWVKFVEPFTAPGTETISSGFCLILRTHLLVTSPFHRWANWGLGNLPLTPQLAEEGVGPSGSKAHTFSDCGVAYISIRLYCELIS